MAMLLSLLVISTLLPLLHSRELDAIYQPTVENLGFSKIFSGDTIRLRCWVSEGPSTWSYVWFRNNLSIEAEDDLSISPAQITDSGDYTCRGQRKTKIGLINTPDSLPMEITVDGGFVMLRAKMSLVVGDTLSASCVVRDNPTLMDVFLYKDGDIVLTNLRNPIFHIPNVKATHQGSYTCKASWNEKGHLITSPSVAIPVTVKDVVTEPILTVNNTKDKNKIKLSCSFESNAHNPATQIHVYFYRDGKKLVGIARSKNNPNLIVLNKPGWYRCKVRLPELNIVRPSQLTPHGNPTESQREQASVPL